MDQTKVAVVAILAVAGIIVTVLGYTFVADHWEDIKTLAIFSIVLGGGFCLAVGGVKLRSGK